MSLRQKLPFILEYFLNKESLNRESKSKTTVEPLGIAIPSRKVVNGDGYNYDGFLLSDPNYLQDLWLKLREKFFPERSDIDDYVVRWSNRDQKRTLASCNITMRRVTVAKEMRDIGLVQYIEPLVYHEMCHAILGKNPGLTPTGRRQWHGKKFKELEARHPGIKKLDEWVLAGGWVKAIRKDRIRK